MPANNHANQRRPCARCIVLMNRHITAGSSLRTTGSHWPQDIKKASALQFASLFYPHVKKNTLNPPNYPRSCKANVNVMLILHVSFYFTISTTSTVTH